MTTPPPGNGRAVAAAYECASRQIARARALVAGGVDADLTPIRPAIRDLCDMLRSMPKNDAAEWLTRLIELQHELARLGQECARRGGTTSGSRDVTRGPGE